MAFQTDEVTGKTPRTNRAAVAPLPHGLALLSVAAREPAWTNLALQLDACGSHNPSLRWASNAVEALAILRDEHFDCLVIVDDGPDEGLPESETARLDGFAFLRAVRTGGHDEPAVMLARDIDETGWETAVELDCAVLVTQRGWESRALVPFIQRELARAELKRDNRRLSMAQQRRLLRERDETEHLLHQQRQILDELQELVGGEAQPPNPPERLPVESPQTSPAAEILTSENVARFYDELLRTYVMMGSGRLGGEIERLARLLVAAGVSLREALGMHLRRVEKLVRGLGSRSSRHVMSRADILALELMIQLGECYRRGVES